MIKIYELIYKIALTMLGIFSIYCFIMAIFGNKSVYKYNYIILIIGAIIYIGLVCLVYQKSKKITNKEFNCSIIIMLSLYLIFTLLFGLRIKSERPADIFNLHNAAVSYLKTGELGGNSYFSVYPMQLIYTYVIIIVYKIGSLIGIQDYRTSGTLFGTMLLFASAILVYKISVKIKDKYLGSVALFVYVTNPIFWIYSSYYYTDLIAMLFILLIIYTALCLNENVVQKRKFLLSFGLGLIVFWGYKLRATVAIGGIAVLALGIIKFYKSNEKKSLINHFIVFCAGCTIAMIIYKIIDNYFGVILDKNKQFPIVHWIMMGLSEQSGGRWSSQLWSYTNNLPTYSDKVSGDIEAIKLSLSNMGAIGFIKLIFQKLSIMWSDGMTALTTNFGTSVYYGNFYEFTIGNKKAVMCYAVQIMRCALLLGVIPFIIYEIRNKFSKYSLLVITFFGYMFFYLFWEVHEKYVLMFLPILIIVAVLGIVTILNKFIEIQKIIIIGNNEIQIDKSSLYKILQRIYIGIFVISFFLLILYWNSMVIKLEKKYNFLVHQSSVTNSIRIGKNAIKQTFLANMKFNGVYVRFLNNDVPKGQLYTFSLYDDSNNCIYQETFNANDIGNDTYHTFCFEEIPVAGYHEFYFEIMAYENYEDTLEICIAGDNYSDYYARGECSVLDEVKGDVTFRVYYIENAGYYSKGFYIIIALSVLLLEVAVFTAIKTK